MLRVLQEYRFERVGGKQLIACDARVIAATNQDLSKAVEAGRFRRDLFYRLNVVPLYIPPLRQRPDDLAPLANQLLKRFAHRYQTDKKSLTATALNALHEHDWTGNVRELENVLERSFLFSEDKVIHRIFFDLLPGSPTSLSQLPNIRDAKKQAADKVECQILQQALEQYAGKVEEVASFLNLSSRAVYQKMQRHGLDSRHYN